MDAKRSRRRTWPLLACAVAVPALSRAGTAYVANEETVTISVIDTATHAVVSTIGLGSDPAIPGTPQPNGPFDGDLLHHRPFYNGHVDPHGLWLDRAGATLLVACRISGTLVAVDTASSEVLGYLPVGREPHLATVRPGKGRGGGEEAWVAIRGEDYVDVVRLGPQLRDPALRRTERIRPLDRVSTARGPSMVSFTSDGRFAFVASGKEARVEKYDAEERRLVASQELSARFTPFGLVSPDDAELYLVHKGAGTVSILRTSDLSFIVRDLPVGPRPNHVEFVGPYAYVTVGGPAAAPGTDPEGKVVLIDRRTHAIANELTGAAWTGEPHAIARTPEGDLYVGHERGNRVTVLATGSAEDAFDDRVVTTITEPRMKRLIDIVTRP